MSESRLSPEATTPARVGRPAQPANTQPAAHPLPFKRAGESGEAGAELHDLRKALDETRAELSARARLRTRVEQHAVERAQLAERAALLEELRAELKAENVRLAADPREARAAATTLIGRAVVAVAGLRPCRRPRHGLVRKLAARISRAGLLDGAWYLRQNRDVVEAGLDPAEHFLLYGAVEGREPCDIRRLARADPSGACA